MIRKHIKRKQLNLNISEDTPDRSKKKRKRALNKTKVKETVSNKTEESLGSLPKEVDDTKLDEVEENDINEVFEDDFSQNDPYALHLNHELSPAILKAISNKPPQLERMKFSWPTLGNLQFERPLSIEDSSSDGAVPQLLGEKTFAQLRSLPESCPQFSWDKLFIKKQILGNIERKLAQTNADGLTNLQMELLNIISNYQDVYFPEENFENIEEIQFIYCAHAINHVLKARLKVMHHNQKLFKKADVLEEYRDQGLVRPKVLILLPFRETAKRVVKMMSSILLGENDNVMNRKRFTDEYTGNEINMPEKNPKPPDYQLLFSGNTDDNFKIGLTVTKKCLKLYADFYSSDIIIASPLGLRMLIGAEGEKNRDYDFLSSIELLIMDQSQVFAMQNWEHVLHVINHLHLQPEEAHDTDLSRVRMWSLNGWSRYYMQSLIFSSYSFPELSALFINKLLNYGGKVAVVNPIKSGTICQVAVHAPQVFHEISAKTCLTAVDDRFETFVSDILPQFKDPSMNHTLIFIPSYFDFVRLRNYFKKQEMKFVHICEYTQEQKITRARSKFFHGKTQFLLYTERFHFYRRIKLRGIRHIIFYQPPTNPNFYSEICNFLHDYKKGDDNEAGEIDLSINVLFTKFDVLQISAIVGTERAVKMLASEKTVHMFMSD
ncbi:hypothetical protein O3M35_007381 [Rhynocoris fuscipes]|uniref:U3 small nucleolar RNA-associated protein 25 homolog n=1 Tax=Rhynocoris fuscipes TaxID=488301 RepID=A0AAW1DEY6_9HEMI